MAFTQILIYLLGGGIRYWLLSNSQVVSKYAGNLVSTPLNSWSRVLEGVYLHRKDVSPYSGNTFHETPLSLVLFDYLTMNWKHMLPFIFTISDLLTAFMLHKFAETYIKNVMKNDNKKGDDVINITSVPAIYLFHPFSLLSCSCMTTTVFANLILSLGLLFTIKEKPILASSLLALATYQSFYPIILVFPAIQYIIQKRPAKYSTKYAIWMIATFLIVLSFLLYISSTIVGWKFLRSVYGYILNVDDLTPNIGIFWYFFMEMFDHFRLFFIWTFQLNTFIYTVPLMVKFRKDPIIVLFTSCCLMATFKSYPSIGDVSFYMSLLPMWAHLYPYMRQSFVIGCIFLVCSLLGPILHYMWIYAGSANANFFFATTMAFSIAQIFLITDILFAYIKWDYHQIHGAEVSVDGKPGKLILK